MASVGLPFKKIKALDGFSIDPKRIVKVADNGKIIIQHGKNKGKEKTIILSNKGKSVETRNGITLKRDYHGFPIFNSKFDTYVPDEMLGNQDHGSYFKY